MGPTLFQIRPQFFRRPYLAFSRESFRFFSIGTKLSASFRRLRRWHVVDFVGDYSSKKGTTPRPRRPSSKSALTLTHANKTTSTDRNSRIISTFPLLPNANRPANPNTRKPVHIFHRPIFGTDSPGPSSILKQVLGRKQKKTSFGPFRHVILLQHTQHTSCPLPIRVTGSMCWCCEEAELWMAMFGFLNDLFACLVSFAVDVVLKGYQFDIKVYFVAVLPSLVERERRRKTLGFFVGFLFVCLETTIASSRNVNR